MELLNYSTDITLINLFIMAGGFVLLIKGSDVFIDSASSIAHRFNIPDVVIGLTLVSIGTSFPELATNVYASVTGEGEIALGNIMGSNIANICLVLGIAALISPSLKVSSKMVDRDAVFMIFTFLLLILFMLVPSENKNLNSLESMFFFILFVVYLIYLFKNQDVMEEEVPEAAQEPRYRGRIAPWFFLMLGLVLIFNGAKLIVDNIVKTAEEFSIPKTIISASVIAFGTSVPELAVTLSGIIKKKSSIALGNIIGSCIFNIILVLGLTGLISTIQVDTNAMSFLAPVMVISGILLYVFMKTSSRLVKYEGLVFILIYIVFIGYTVKQVGN